MNDAFLVRGDAGEIGAVKDCVLQRTSLEQRGLAPDIRDGGRCASGLGGHGGIAALPGHVLGSLGSPNLGALGDPLPEHESRQMRVVPIWGDSVSSADWFGGEMCPDFDNI